MRRPLQRHPTRYGLHTVFTALFKVARSMHCKERSVEFRLLCWGRERMLARTWLEKNTCKSSGSHLVRCKKVHIYRYPISPHIPAVSMSLKTAVNKILDVRKTLTGYSDPKNIFSYHKKRLFKDAMIHYLDSTLAHYKCDASFLYVLEDYNVPHNQQII